MQYRQDLMSGTELSVLGFGCMRFPRTGAATVAGHGIGGRIDQVATTELIRSAIASGINYFDTAYGYSGSEAALGSALEELGLRNQVYIATKLPHQMCRTPEDLDRFFSEQLTRLRTEHIDYYLIHNLPTIDAWQRVVALGIEDWIAEKKAAGLIGQIGFSFHGAQDQFLQLLDAYDWEFTQIQYNYLNIGFQAGRVGLHAAAAKGLMVIVMEPLLGGWLANKLPQAAVSVLHNADPSLSPADWALQWLWDQPEVTMLLSGMRTADELNANVQAATRANIGSMTPVQHAAIEQATALIESANRIPCTACNYCMPCPQGVNIPACFTSYNASYSQSFFTAMQQYMMSISVMSDGPVKGAAACTSCGACLKLCPQQIAIPNELPRVARRLESAPIKVGMKLARRIMTGSRSKTDANTEG